MPAPSLRIAHARATDANPDALWGAAGAVRIADAGLLGRLIKWRIPGTASGITFDQLFRAQPFIVLCEEQRALVSGMVGRIWTLRRDYPRLTEPDEFRAWSQGGTARVLFANWVADGALHSEARVDAFGARGRAGLATVKPLVSTFHHLIASDGLAAAVRSAERPGEPEGPPGPAQR